jgi:hypothetical protein
VIIEEEAKLKRTVLSCFFAAVMALPLFSPFLPAGFPPASADTPDAVPANNVLVASTTADSAVISLTNETIDLPDGFSVTAYSLDGGSTWYRRPLPSGDQFKKLFNKEMTLWLTDRFDRKAKSPATASDGAEAAVVIRFPKINARPKRNTVRTFPFYTDTHWFLTKHGTTEEVFSGYEYATSSNRRTPDEGLWFPMPRGGFEIASGRTRPTTLVRFAPSGVTPGSVMWRVRPANFGKTPRYTFRNRRDLADRSQRISTLSLRTGYQYAFDRENYRPPLNAKTMLNAADMARRNLNIHVRRAGTGKRPPSEVLTLSLPAPPSVLLRTIQVPRPARYAAAAPQPGDTSFYTVETWAWNNLDTGGIYPKNRPFHLRIVLEGEDYDFAGINKANLDWLFPGNEEIIIDITIDDDGLFTFEIKVHYDLRILITDLNKWLKATATRPTGGGGTVGDLSVYFTLLPDAPFTVSLPAHGYGLWLARAQSGQDFDLVAGLELTVNTGYKFGDSYSLSLDKDYTIFDIVGFTNNETTIIFFVGYTPPLP